MTKHRFDGGRRKSAKVRFTLHLAAMVGASLSSPLLAQTAAPPAAMPAEPLVSATPAMWQIRDADTTIYLLGTFHTLDARTAWFDDRLRAAFDQSGELILETLVPTDGDEIRAAGKIASDEPATPGGARREKPFIAQTRVVIDQGRANGLSVDHGVDTVLRRVADEVGKPVAGLETFAEQLGTLARIPAVPAPAMTVAAPQVAEVPAVTLDQLLSAWKLGDMTAFSTMLSGFKTKSPVAYRMLISDRNARWGEWIARRMDYPGTVFVAVGAGHLAGKDSVQQWLANQGIASTRIH